MSALSRQKIEIETPGTDCLLLYDGQKQEAAIERASALRRAGKNLQLLRKQDSTELQEYAAYARRNHLKEILYLSAEDDEIKSIQTEEGDL